MKRDQPFRLLRLPATIMLATVALFVLLTGCARNQPIPRSVTTPFVPESTEQATVPAPLFFVENAEQPYNRIGTPRAHPPANDGSEPHIAVDPAVATVYHGRDHFSTTRARYTNDIYRIHFEQVPFGWEALNLTAGTNPGLLVIFTTDEAGTLLLVTTVHTCGCYLAFIPTTAMPADAFPADWPSSGQEIYGHQLPSMLIPPPPGYLMAFTLADQTHRIADVAVVAPDTIAGDRRVHMAIASLEELYRLPYEAATVSFFETDGQRAGYVKNNTKIFERLLLGWLALDLRVGEDKAFLGGDTSEIPLYTSLKFWARHESDLKDFARFLTYWGWNL